MESLRELIERQKEEALTQSGFGWLILADRLVRNIAEIEEQLIDLKWDKQFAADEAAERSYQAFKEPVKHKVPASAQLPMVKTESEKKEPNGRLCQLCGKPLFNQRRKFCNTSEANHYLYLKRTGKLNRIPSKVKISNKDNSSVAVVAGVGVRPAHNKDREPAVA